MYTETNFYFEGTLPEYATSELAPKSFEKTVCTADALSSDADFSLEFLMHLSHEFKTPLNIILSSLQLMRRKLRSSDQPLSESEYEKIFGYIEQNSYKLLRLVSNLIDLKKAETDFLEMRFKPCDLNLLLPDLIDSVNIYAAAKNIALTFSSGIEGAASLCCDSEKVERIVMNLISNAIKNTDPGGTIDVSLQSAEESLVISVSDTGIGIDPSLLPHIFEAREKKPCDSVRNCDGGGVGLSIVKTLVSAHGGTVRVESIPGRGSRFEVLLKTRPNSFYTDALLLKSFSVEETRAIRILTEMSGLRK